MRIFFLLPTDTELPGVVLIISRQARMMLMIENGAKYPRHSQRMIGRTSLLSESPPQLDP